MASIADLVVGLTLSADPFLKGLDAAADKASAFSDVATTALGTALGGVITGGLSLVGGAASSAFGLLTSGIQDAADASQQLAQTEAVIKSTGGAAGVTAEQVEEMASSLSAAEGASTFGDSDVLGLTNLLLTFTNIKGEILEGATQIGVDMATALGTEPQAAAVQLGKALNDPVAGISALSRVGVTFTDTQKGMIKSMVEAGNVAGAQQVILDELGKEFGGSAAAAADTLKGKWGQLKDIGGELAESIGGALLPGLTQLVTTLATPANVEWITGAAEAIGTGLAGAMEWVIGTGIPAMQSGFAAIQPILSAAWDAFTNIANGVRNLAAVASNGGLMNLFVIFEDGTSAISSFLERLGFAEPVALAVNNALAAIASTVMQVITTIAGAATGEGGGLLALFPPELVTAAQGLMATFGEVGAYLASQWPGFVAGASEVWNSVFLPVISAVGDFLLSTLYPALLNIATFLISNIPAAVEVAGAVWSNVLFPALQAVGGFITGTVIPNLTLLVTWLSANVPAAIATVSTFFTGTLLPAMTTAGNWINANLIPFLSALGEVLTAVVGVAVTALAGLWQNVLQPALQTVGDYISSKVNPVLSSIADTINGVVRQALSWFGEYLPTISAGLSGVSSAIQTATQWLSGLANSLNNLELPAWLTPGSPTPLENAMWTLADSFSAVGDAAGEAFTGLAAPIGQTTDSMARLIPSLEHVMALNEELIEGGASDWTGAMEALNASAAELGPDVQAAVDQVLAAYDDAGIGSMEYQQTVDALYQKLWELDNAAAAMAEATPAIDAAATATPGASARTETANDQATLESLIADAVIDSGARIEERLTAMQNVIANALADLRQTTASLRGSQVLA